MREVVDSPTTGSDDIVQRLVTAIQEGHLRRTLADLESVGSRLTASDRSRVAEAAVAAAAIDAAVSAERVRLTERFVAFGVTSAVASRVLDGRPLHMLAFTVAPREVTLAAEALETAGYRGVAPSTSAACLPGHQRIRSIPPRRSGSVQSRSDMVLATVGRAGTGGETAHTHAI